MPDEALNPFDAEMDKWDRRMQRHGWPTIYLALQILAFIVVASWLKPWIESAFTSHNTFVNRTADNNDKVAKAMVQFAASAEQQAKNMERLTEQHRESLLLLQSMQRQKE